MEKAKWIWFDGQQVPWDDAKTHVLSHTLHYGGGAFEGIRFYKTSKGPAVYRLQEHIERLLKSCSAIQLNLEYSAAQIEQAVLDTIAINNIEQGYIRPLAFWGTGDLRIISDALEKHLIIAV